MNNTYKAGDSVVACSVLCAYDDADTDVTITQGTQGMVMSEPFEQGGMVQVMWRGGGAQGWGVYYQDEIAKAALS